MFLILFVALLVTWIFGWIMFRAVGALIHILLIVAIIALILHFARSG